MKEIPLSLDHLIREGDMEELKETLNRLSPFEIADFLVNTPADERETLFEVLSPERAQHTFDFLPVKVQKQLLHTMSKEKAGTLLKGLSPDDRTSFLQEVPRDVLDDLVKLLPHDDRMLTLTLLGYPEGSVGRLMTPDYIAVKLDWTIDDVLDHIRIYGSNSETTDVIYVIDDEGKLLDDIKLRDLLFVPRTSKVESLSDKRFVALSAYDKDEAAVNIFKSFDRVALPVIDEEGILLGIVTIDDILRISNQEATKDMQKFSGMEAIDEPYLKVPFLVMMQKRAGWLVVLFLGEMMTATALGFFEGEIAKAVVLALFLPLIISSGGNAGSQASTLIIRALALGEVKLKDWWRVIRREILSGLFLGTVLGVIGFFRVSIWSLFTNLYGEHWLLIAVTIGLSLIGVVLWGTLSGATFPLILRRLGIDPATSSAPLVATVVDVTGIIIYFLIALMILRGVIL